MPITTLDAIIFDKDGTLFDFTASWGAWLQGLLGQIASDDAHAGALAAALGYDRAAKIFAKTSPVIAMTTPEIAAVIHPLLPNLTFAALNEVMNAQAACAPMLPAVDLPAVLGGLRARGLRLGVATNDTEAPARAHLHTAGVLEMFDFIAGCDSGWGGKPAAGQLFAFASALGLDPARCAMVGDSLHDLHAARAAGMYAVAVLTGVAEAADLAPHADVVLPDIGHLPLWLDALMPKNDI